MRENLRSARKCAGLTQREVADALGLSKRHYQRIEKGETYGTIDTWDKLEDMFNVHQRTLRENYPDKEANQ